MLCNMIKIRFSTKNVHSLFRISDVTSPSCQPHLIMLSGEMVTIVTSRQKSALLAFHYEKGKELVAELFTTLFLMQIKLLSVLCSTYVC